MSEDFDKQKILELIRVIERDYALVMKAEIKDAEELKASRERYYFISMALFNIFNKMIELGEELIDFLKLEYPLKYREIPKFLFERKILTKEQFKTFDDFIRYRNAISHEYDEIHEEEIFWCIKHLEFVREFIGISRKQMLK